MVSAGTPDLGVSSSATLSIPTNSALPKLWVPRNNPDSQALTPWKIHKPTPHLGFSKGKLLSLGKSQRNGEKTREMAGLE